MKLAQMLLIFSFAASCSDSKSAKPVPEEQPKVVKLDESSPAPTVTPTPVPAPTATPSPTPTSIPSVKIKSTFSLFTFSAQESGFARAAGKIVSVSIKPLKVTSSAGINGSLLTAKCGTEVIAQSKVFLLTNDRETGANYMPSIVIPPDVVCASEIAVTIAIYGFDVELGDVNVADVVSVGKASLIAE